MTTRAANINQAGHDDRSRGEISVSEAEKDACFQQVLAVFPDICLEYLGKVALTYGYDADETINIVMDQEEAGSSYRRRPKDNILKRKRSDGEKADAIEEAISKAKRKYDNSERRARSLTLGQVCRMQEMLCADFPLLTAQKIQAKLSENGHLLLPTYLALYESTRTSSQNAQLWNPSLIWTAGINHQTYGSAAYHMTTSTEPIDKDILEEIHSARSICRARENKRRLKEAEEKAEKKNYEDAKAQGFVSECECCFVEFALNRLVHCNGKILHFFCTNCARRQAESLVGLSKFELSCMSMDGCSAGFSCEERSKFLDDKLVSALDRIEQEAVLRIADIENLATCPFCPFAAEYPPVEEDKEFRCQNPECQIVSCRLCNAETHVPKSCEEAARENAYSARRKIEEAMSAAMIRKCNKCSTPFIKEDGCNKMTCTRTGCYNVQCYVCSVSCDYSHFNDPTRGGKTGNCPLFDNVDARHDEEVKKAEEQARTRITKERPGLDPDFLKIQMSAAVTNDEQRRAAAQVNMRHRRHHHHRANAQQMQAPEAMYRVEPGPPFQIPFALPPALPMALAHNPAQGVGVPAHHAVKEARVPERHRPKLVPDMIRGAWPGFGQVFHPRNLVDGAQANIMGMQAGPLQQTNKFAPLRINEPQQGPEGRQAMPYAGQFQIQAMGRREPERVRNIEHEVATLLQANAGANAGAQVGANVPQRSVQERLDRMHRQMQEIAARAAKEHNIADVEARKKALSSATLTRAGKGGANARAKIEEAFNRDVAAARQRVANNNDQNLVDQRELHRKHPGLKEEPGVRRSARLATVASADPRRRAKPSQRPGSQHQT